MTRTAHIPAKRAWVAAATCALVPLVGCGGSGKGASTHQTGRRALTLTFRWPTAPASSRVLPAATQSVVVRVQDARGFGDQAVVNRPAAVGDRFGTVQFFALSPGTARVQGQAYSGANGSGQILAEAGQTLTLERGETDTATLTFDAAYTAIRVEPEAGATLPVLQGQTLRLVARGVVADGTVVEPSPDGTYTSSNPAIAAVDATTGVVTGVAPGTALVTFIDTFGRAGGIEVSVRGGDAEVTIQ